jgi:hypothetical protein
MLLQLGNTEVSINDLWTPVCVPSVEIQLKHVNLLKQVKQFEPAAMEY